MTLVRGGHGGAVAVAVAVVYVYWFTGLHVQARCPTCAYLVRRVQRQPTYAASEHVHRHQQRNDRPAYHLVLVTNVVTRGRILAVVLALGSQQHQTEQAIRHRNERGYRTVMLLLVVVVVG